MSESIICNALRWCVSQVFLVRGVIDSPIVDLYDSCPYHDTWESHQLITFTALFNHPLARYVVGLWWMVYDILRDSDVIPDANPTKEEAWD